MKRESVIKKIAVPVLVLTATAFIFGCTQTFTAQPVTSDTPPPEAAEDTAASGTGAGAVDAKPAAQKATAVYYDFEDVLIPLELSIVQDQTMVVSTPGFTSGILVLKGRVERYSLINFFNTNMRKDNWTVMSQIKSPGNTILVFEKPTKCAVITIKNGQFNTWVEIGVAARVSHEDLPAGGSGMTQTDLNQ